MCSGKFREDHADGGRRFVQREPAAAAKKTLLRRVPAHFLCAEVDGQSVSESGEGSGAAVREDGPVREILFAGQARQRQDVAGEIVGEIAALRVAAVFERPVPDVGKIVAAAGKRRVRRDAVLPDEFNALECSKAVQSYIYTPVFFVA